MKYRYFAVILVGAFAMIAQASEISAQESPVSVGFRRITTSGGLKISVWYPASARPEAFDYGVRGTQSTVAYEAPVAGETTYPLIIFSHGFKGCGIQSVFLTEALAAAGYIVAAPDHADAACDRAGRRKRKIAHGPEVKFRDHEKWTEETYVDRRNDLAAVIDELTGSSEFGPHIDAARIGAAGHSLGGYTVLGMAGGWRSWKDTRIKAVLAMSPAGHPYLINGRIAGIDVPVMYHGADRDLALTPIMAREGGLYDTSNAPKYYIQLRRQGHFAWSNLSCASLKSVSECVEQREHVRLINQYALAFFDRYLKGRAVPLLRNGRGLSDYRHSD